MLAGRRARARGFDSFIYRNVAGVRQTDSVAEGGALTAAIMRRRAVVDLGPLTSDFESGPDLDVCWCRQCSRGPECSVMEQRRAEMWLTEMDRQWLRAQGWIPA